MNSNRFDLWYMFCQIIFVLYRSIYHFENVCISNNDVIDTYILWMSLTYNHFDVNVAKIKHEINLF